MATGKQLAELADIDAIADADTFPVRDASASTELKEATAVQLATYMASELAATFQPLDADLTAVAGAGNGSVLAATTASFTTADETKLDGIEAAADVTDATNVAAAGAAMLADSPSELVPDPPEVVSGTTDTLAAADHGHLNRYTNASQVTVTLPTDASADLVDGFWCALYAEGAGGLTLSTTGITLTGSAPFTSIAQNEVMVVMKTATANTWLVMGATS